MRIESVYPAGFIPVPYIFIDRYMCAANGEFVKTYLLLLRLAGEQDLSISLLADRLEQTEKDVRRGLKYWEKEGLLAAEEESGQIHRLLLCYPGEPLPESYRKQAAGKETRSEAAGASAAPEQKALPVAAEKATAPAPSRTPQEVVAEEKADRSYSAAQLNVLKKQEDFIQLLFVVEHYLGRTLSSQDTDIFAYLFDELKFPEEVLEYLVEYCVDIWEKRGQKKDYNLIRYMEQVALNWHKSGALTLEKAKQQVRLFAQENTSYREIEKALGLKGRQLTEDERSFFFHWMFEENLPQELILEACRRTIRAKGAYEQPYMNAILEGWKKQGIRTLEDVEAADRRHAAQKNDPTAKKTKTKEENGSRRIDYDAAIRDLYVQSLQYGSEE